MTVKLATAAGVTAFSRQEPATLSGQSGEAFYGMMKNIQGSTLDVKLVVVALERDLWAIETIMTPRYLAAGARAQINQMVDRITLTKDP